MYTQYPVFLLKYKVLFASIIVLTSVFALCEYSPGLFWKNVRLKSENVKVEDHIIDTCLCKLKLLELK